jgi:hypothetical protein
MPGPIHSREEEIEKLSFFVEPEGSSAFSQKPATGATKPLVCP